MSQSSKRDLFGAPVSHPDNADIATFGEAAERMLAYRPDPVGILKELLEKSPDFIMARCFLAGIYLTASDMRRRPALLEQLLILKEQVGQANERERQHITALSLWAEGNFFAASRAYADILADYPRDLVALQIGHQTDFLLGQVTSTRDRPARVRPHWTSEDSQLSFILGMQAFGMEEAGHYAAAQVLAEQAVTLNPNDSWSVHALAHCFEMQGKTDEGIKFMTGCEAHWGQDSYMSIHNRWHLMLYHMERCEFDSVLEVHDRFMTITADNELMDAHDSVALLQRLRIAGVDVGSRWNAVADYYAQVRDQAYMAFNDIHGMMAFTAAGRLDDAKAQLVALEAHVTNHQDDRANIIEMVGLPLVRGFFAHGTGDYKGAKTWLGQARHSSRAIGGSDAQRDIISQTLLDAAVKDGDSGIAAALIAERRASKPHSPLLNHFERAQHPQGNRVSFNMNE